MKLFELFGEVALKGMDKVQGNLSKVTQHAEKVRSGINVAGKAFAVAGGVIVAASLKAAHAAGIQEEAENTLAQAMKQAGTFTEEAFQANLKLASSLQQRTKFGDEEILNAQKRLVNFGIEGEMLAELTKASIDLASAKKMKLSAAFDLVSKSVGSTTNAMSRYGITIEGAVGSTERAEMAVDQITKLFGGAAAAEADTYLGKLKQLSNRWGDFIEKIGVGVIPVMTQLMDIVNNSVLPLFEDWINSINETDTSANIFTQTLQFVIKTMMGLIAVLDIGASAWMALGNAMTFHFDAAKQFLDDAVSKTEKYGDSIRKISDLEIQTSKKKETAKRKDVNATTEAVIESEKTKAEATEKANEEIVEDTADTAKQLKKISGKVANAFDDDIFNMLKGTRNFGEGVQDIFQSIGDFVLKTIAQMVAKWLAFAAIKGIASIFGLGGIAGKIFGFAQGADFTVPSGFPNDSFIMPPVGLTSGERVQVTPAGQVGGGLQGSGGTVNLSINMPIEKLELSPKNARETAREFTEELKAGATELLDMAKEVSLQNEFTEGEA